MTFDPQAGAVISVRNPDESWGTFLVVITLIDWASLLEVESLLVNKVGGGTMRIRFFQTHYTISRIQSSSVLHPAPIYTVS